MLDPFWSDSFGKFVLRLTVGGLMLFHGVAKLLHPGTVEFIGTRVVEAGLPQYVAYGVYAGEVIGPLLLIIGVFSRWGAAMIAVGMLFAVGLVHMGDLAELTKHGGWRMELQAFYLFGALAIVFLGSGRFAVKPD